MRKEITSVFMVFLILTSVLTVGFVTAPAPERVPVIVGFKGKADAGLIRAHGGDIKYEYGMISAVACSLPQGAIDALNKNPNIAYIEPDGKVQITQEEEELPWGVARIDANDVHPYNKGTGVKVAIIDTGIDYDHPDLVDNYIEGYDFVNNDSDPMDDAGHGTHCAGIVAAEDNEIGVIGVAPEAELYAVKVLDSKGSGYVSDVIAGIEWATGNGMQIISMSLGSDSDNEALHTACDKAYGEGVLVVAAAGNDYQRRGRAEFDTVDYPARYDSVIAVGATDDTDTKASWSSTGLALELTAPGVSIYSTYWD
ncbi:MAG: S8 family peptidase, partial [Candidatus Bathyarchaeota archaeon]|nr:S8 family peptidase [Candidatus Bathyarchaeota archaeon]